jgi:predicted transcriptional regulator
MVFIFPVGLNTWVILVMIYLTIDDDLSRVLESIARKSIRTNINLLGISIVQLFKVSDTQLHVLKWEKSPV